MIKFSEYLKEKMAIGTLGSPGLEASIRSLLDSSSGSSFMRAINNKQLSKARDIAKRFFGDMKKVHDVLDWFKKNVL